MRTLIPLFVMFLWFSGKKVHSAPGDYNIPVRNIGNTSINTTVPKTTFDWGFFIQNPTIPSPVVPGTMGFAQLVPWNQNTFTLNGSGQLDLAPAFYTWLETDYVPRDEVETMIDGITAGQFSGDYNDLTNKPTLFSGNYSDLAGKPTLFSGNYNDLSNLPTLFSGAYADLTGKPSLFDGDYNSLTNKPTIPAAQVQSDWNASSGLGVILNKPTLFNGAYSSLTGIPSTFTPAPHNQAWSTITSTPTTISGYGITDFNWTTLSGKPSTFTPSAHTHAWSDITTGKPTTLSGYGITDPVVLTSGSYSNPSWITGLAWSKITGAPSFITGISASDVNAALGFTPMSQSGARSSISLTTTGSGAATYNNSTGVLNVPTPVSAKRQETYSGTTNASGVYTVTFGTAYAVAPNIQAGLINGADNQNLRVTSITTTGFSVLARNRVDVIGLLPTWTNVTGIGVDVLITEK